MNVYVSHTYVLNAEKKKTFTPPREQLIKLDSDNNAEFWVKPVKNQPGHWLWQFS